MRSLRSETAFSPQTRRPATKRAVGAICGFLLLLGTVAACGSDPEEPLIYSGTGQIVPAAAE